jgi:hypothetical protein
MLYLTADKFPVCESLRRFEADRAAHTYCTQSYRLE